MRKKIFIGISFVGIVGAALTVYFMTRHKKKEISYGENEKGFYVIKGKGTIYTEEIVVPEGTTYHDAIYLLNFNVPIQINDITTKTLLKPNSKQAIHREPGDLIHDDVTIKVE